MDPQQQQQLTGMMAGMGAAIVLVWLLALGFFVFLFWRIFTKAGMAGPLALIALFPGLGIIVVLCLLAFSKWQVAPIPPGYAAGMQPYPPAYPPQPYPPTNYPPAGPPAQL